jgi:hypothetical protein
MLSSILTALGLDDDEVGQGEPQEKQSQSQSLVQRNGSDRTPASAIDQFNDNVADIHVCLSEGRLIHALEVLDEFDAVYARHSHAPAVSIQAVATDVENTTHVASSAQPGNGNQTSSTGSSSGVSTAEQEIIDAVRRKIEDAFVRQFEHASDVAEMPAVIEVWGSMHTHAFSRGVVQAQEAFERIFTNFGDATLRYVPSVYSPSTSKSSNP